MDIDTAIVLNEFVEGAEERGESQRWAENVRNEIEEHDHDDPDFAREYIDSARKTHNKVVSIAEQHSDPATALAAVIAWFDGRCATD